MRRSWINGTALRLTRWMRQARAARTLTPKSPPGRPALAGASRRHGSVPSWASIEGRNAARERAVDLVDHPVRAQHRDLRDLDADLPRDTAVDDQLEPLRLLDRHLRGLCPAQDAIDDHGGAPVVLPAVGAVADDRPKSCLADIGCDQRNPGLQRALAPRNTRRFNRSPGPREP